MEQIEKNIEELSKWVDEGKDRAVVVIATELSQDKEKNGFNLQQIYCLNGNGRVIIEGLKEALVADNKELQNLVSKAVMENIVESTIKKATK